jgi:hypothetical protein
MAEQTRTLRIWLTCLELNKQNGFNSDMFLRRITYSPRIIALGAVIALPFSASLAQDSQLGLKAPELELPKLNLQVEQAPADDQAIAPAAGPVSPLRLNAALTEKADPISSDMVWRVFNATPDAEGKLILAAKASGGASEILLPPGEYLVHAAYGRAGATKRVIVGDEPVEETLVLNAGGIMLNANVGSGTTIAPEKLKFSIYDAEVDANGERRLIVADVTPGAVVRLNEGPYHIVSTYGSVNAIIRTDVRVEAGVVTEATMQQRAAELTFKLVSQAGGEALADTSWSVFTESGEVLFESVGAYSSAVLAEGGYSVVAKHRGRLFERVINVESGRNGDVEVLATF